MLRLKLILIYILMGLSAQSSLNFTYNIEVGGGSEHTWVKIKRILIDNNGWRWYVDNFLNKNCILEISLIKDSDRYAMIIATWPEKAPDFYDKLAKTINVLAQNNDTILIDMQHYDICLLPVNMRLANIPDDIESLISEKQQSMLRHCLNEFLFCFSVWHGVWYNVSSLSSNSLCQNLFYKGFSFNNDAAFISNRVLMDEYIEECKTKKIPCLLGHTSLGQHANTLSSNKKASLDNDCAAMELLRKYVDRNDSVLLSNPIAGKRHIMNFKFESIELNCDNSLTNLR